MKTFKELINEKTTASKFIKTVMKKDDRVRAFEITKGVITFWINGYIGDLKDMEVFFTHQLKETCGLKIIDSKKDTKSMTLLITVK